MWRNYSNDMYNTSERTELWSLHLPPSFHLLFTWCRFNHNSRKSTKLTVESTNLAVIFPLGIFFSRINIPKRVLGDQLDFERSSSFANNNNNNKRNDISKAPNHRLSVTNNRNNCLPQNTRLVAYEMRLWWLLRIEGVIT